MSSQYPNYESDRPKSSPAVIVLAVLAVLGVVLFAGAKYSEASNRVDHACRSAVAAGYDTSC